MRALVTGGGGFLGRCLVERLLARGDQVRILARGAYPDLAAQGVACVRGDVSDGAVAAAACAGMDTVFHVAALADYWGPYAAFATVNLRGTEQLLTACRAQGVRRFVYTSTPSVVFPMGDLCGVNESQPYPPRFYAHYPHTKALAEQAVLAANGRDGLSTCALRPHLIWGPRDTHLLPLVMQRAASGQLRQIGRGDNRVDLCYVDNAAQAHVQAADALQPGAPAAGHAYFISDGAPVGLWDWVNDFLQRMDLPPVRRRVPYGLAYTLALLGETAYTWLPLRGRPRLTRFLVGNFAYSHYFDISAAARDFGYVPAVSNDTGLQRTVDWFRTHPAVAAI